MNRKEWDRKLKMGSHRSKPRKDWTFGDVTKEFALQVEVARMKGWEPVSIFPTQAKRTEIGLRYMRESFGLTPSEAAEYVEDFFSELVGASDVSRRGPSRGGLDAEWLQFLHYVQARGLARRGRKSDFRDERWALRVRVFPRGNSHNQVDGGLIDVEGSQPVMDRSTGLPQG